MSATIKAAAKRAVGAVSVRRTVRQLGQGHSEAAAELARVLRALDARPSADDARWFATVEELRERLEASSTPLEVVSYGAGTPGAQRSQDQMDEGRSSTQTVGHITKLTSKPPRWAQLLYHVVRERRPGTAIELGTSMGISAAYQAGALRAVGGRRLITIEGSPDSARHAREHLASIGLGDLVEVREGRFQDALGPALEDLGSVEYAFVDGHHDEQATKDYFAQLLPYAPAGATLAFDDIAWSDGMRRAWAEIRRHPRVDLSLDLGVVGFAVLEAGEPEPLHVDGRLA